MKNKKVLIISYYWPPAGGPGVQRWLKLSKYLPQYGWDPIIYTPENPDFQVLDETLSKDIHPDTQVIKHPIWEPYAFFRKLTGKNKQEKVNSGLLFDEKNISLFTKLALWVRGNILIPDPRKFWVKPSIKYLIKRIPNINPDIIITTGPPHSMHLIGLKLHKETGIPWLADFRDPWSNLDVLDIFSPSKYAKNKQRRLEKKVLETATATIAVSSNWEKELRSLGAKNTFTITNGFDESDFKTYQATKATKFSIVYGGIITSFRNPVLLWVALEELCSEIHSFREDLAITLAGTIDNLVKKDISHFTYLSEKTKYINYFPHQELLNMYSQSAILLLLLNNTPNAQGHIPGKLFEYLACQKPILAVGVTDGDVANILKETKTGCIAEFKDKQQIKDNIQLLYEQFKNDTYQTTANIEKYSRKALAESLSDKMYGIMNKR